MTALVLCASAFEYRNIPGTSMASERSRERIKCLFILAYFDFDFLDAIKINNATMIMTAPPNPAYVIMAST